MKLKSEKRNKKESKFCTKIVIFSIAFIVAYTVAQMILSYKLNIELSPTLTTCVYAFFGTELATTALIRIFDKKFGKEDYNDEFSE